MRVIVESPFAGGFANVKYSRECIKDCLNRGESPFASHLLYTQKGVLNDIYNALDCCLTAEILDVIKPQLDNITRATYEFSKSLQAPVLEMRMRGIRVDEPGDALLLTPIPPICEPSSQPQSYPLEGIGCPINWNSPAQLKKLLYEVLGLPPRRSATEGPLHRNRGPRRA
jgi:DNA polymerase I-like protein with 3'-5' exonuclease and polymerase domains